MVTITGTGGQYSVTRCGKVWSHRRNLFLKPGKIGNGYRKVSLSRFGEKYKNWYIHRLVAEAFIPNPDNKPTVNHKDGDKTNNAESNLEWATQKEQSDHAISTGLAEYNGVENGAAILDDAKVIAMRTKYATKQFSHEALAQEYGVTRACVLRVVRGQTWKHLPFDCACDVTRWRDRGANRKTATWTAEQVREIRIKYVEGGYTTRRLAELYGGHHSGVWNVVNFRTYTDQDHDLRPQPFGTNPATAEFRVS